MFSLAYILRESSDHYPPKMAINIIRFLLACLNQDHTPPSNSKKTTKIVLGTSMKGKNIFHYLVGVNLHQRDYFLCISKL